MPGSWDEIVSLALELPSILGLEMESIRFPGGETERCTVFKGMITIWNVPGMLRAGGFQRVC